MISTGLLNAQTDFRSGYVIDISGDTLSGKIDYRGDLLMNSICKYKNPDQTIKEYSPNDIIAFRFIDSKYFISKEINGKNVFLEYLIKGKVNIYYMQDAAGEHYYIDKKGFELAELPYKTKIKYVEDKTFRYVLKRHIGILNYYMQDAPEFQSRINGIKKPNHHNLVELAEDYHNTVCEGEKCIIFEKKIPLINIFPEIAGGVIKYSNVENLKDKFYFHTGIIGHIWMPSASEKMYFRTGVLFSLLDLENKIESFYKIPFQFEYIYPKGIFRPRFACGLNFYVPRFQSVSFNFGANLELTETLFLSVTSDIEFDPTAVIIPKDLLSYSLKLGIFMKFK